MKRALVCGAGGFIGSHVVKRLKREGFWVRGVDLNHPEFRESDADEFVIGDLRLQSTCAAVVEGALDEVYQFAADMGGAGYIFVGDHDASIMHSSATINLNMIEALYRSGNRQVFYSSSACIYPAYNQTDALHPNCVEHSAYPAAPDSEYGWEKLFSERLFLAYNRNHGMRSRVARFHNVFGPEGTWRGGKEKAPAAICRKIAMASDGDAIEIWGDGSQTRSFLYVDECVEGTVRLMRSDFEGPVNVGSDEMISIDRLVDVIADIAGKRIVKHHVEGPQGVRGRTSDNDLILKELGWRPSQPLRTGLERTYDWIYRNVRASMKA